MRDFRIMWMRPKAYAVYLGILCALGFAVGGAMNFVHARNDPSADPYRVTSRAPEGPPAAR